MIGPDLDPAPSSGVLGGLPNPNPTGFPMLPALTAPNPALKSEGLPGEADPNVNAGCFSLSLSFSGVVAPVLVPVPKGVEEEDEPVPKMETGADGLSASLALPKIEDALVLVEDELKRGDGAAVEDEPNIELEEGAAEEPKRDGVEEDVVLLDPPNPLNVELLEGGPNLNALVGGADGAEVEVEVDEGAPKVNAGFGASVEDDSAAFEEGAKLNGVPSAAGLPESNFGVNPPEAGVEDVEDEDTEGNPAKPLGAAGIEKDAGGFGGSDTLGGAVKELVGAEVMLDAGLDFPSKSDFTETRRLLYRSSNSATSTKGSDSIAFETAERKEIFRPRMAL